MSVYYRQVQIFLKVVVLYLILWAASDCCSRSVSVNLRFGPMFRNGLVTWSQNSVYEGRGVLFGLDIACNVCFGSDNFANKLLATMYSSGAVLTAFSQYTCCWYFWC